MADAGRLRFPGVVALALGLASATACNLGIQVGEVVAGSTGASVVSLAGQPGSAITATATEPGPCQLDVDFGVVPIGGIGYAPIRIQNFGAGPLLVSTYDPALDPQFSLTAEAPDPIGQGAFGEFTAKFQPVEIGSVQSKFEILADGVDGPCHVDGGDDGAVITVLLTGHGQLALVVQPDVVDFGNTLLETKAMQSVMLVNGSNTAVTGITATVGGPDAARFALDDIVPSILAPGASAMLAISFLPTQLETRAIGEVSFQTSAGETAILNLFGEPVGVALTLAPNPCDFSYGVLNRTSVCCTTVTNQANVEVSITGFSGFANEGGDFEFATTDDSTPPNPQTFPRIPINLPGGTSAKVCFSFTPTINQAYSGRVTLVTTDPTGANPIVQLMGWGGGPEISCSPRTLGFSRDGGGASTLPVVCTNIGTDVTPSTNLVISPPTASPAIFKAQFDQSTYVYPPDGLAPGESAQIDVTCSFGADVPDGGRLSIVNNGGQGKPVEIPLFIGRD